MAYWDTSCLIKLYVPEADSETIRNYASAHEIVTSSIARLELWATVRRKEAEGALKPNGAVRALEAFDEDVALGTVLIRSIDALVTEQFVAAVDQLFTSSPPIHLGTLDAVHLATAAVAEETEIVATDKQLRKAATALGFNLYPPA